MVSLPRVFHPFELKNRITQYSQTIFGKNCQVKWGVKMPTFKITNSTIKKINIYRGARKDESCTEGALAKFTPSQKDAIQKICNKHGFSVSGFLRDAAAIYLYLFPYKTKIEDDPEFVCQFLSKLK